MLSEVFVAGSDDEAKGYLSDGAAAAGVDAVVETTDLTSMELDLLQSVLTEQPLKHVLREPGGGVIAYGGDQGPWVEDVRPTRRRCWRSWWGWRSPRGSASPTCTCGTRSTESP